MNRLQRWWMEAWPHRWHLARRLPAFLKDCPEPFRGEVLEVGAGSGFSSRHILNTFPQVELTVTDVEESVLVKHEVLQEKYGSRLHVKVADIHQLPFDRTSFDIVVAVHVLGRLPDVRGAVEEMLRVTRAGGLIGIVDGSDVNWKEELMRVGAEIVKLKKEGHQEIWTRKPYE